MNSEFGRCRTGLLAVLPYFLLLTLSGCGTAYTANASNNGATGGSLNGTGRLPLLSAFDCATDSVIGTTTDICTVKLSGVSPSAPVTVSLSSSDPAVSVPATVTVPANLAAVQFTANILSVLTSQTATLTAIDGGAPMSIALQLSAATQTLGLSSSRLNFQYVALNAAATQSVTLKSTGTEPIVISSVLAAGAGFSVSSTALPLTLKPGQTAMLTVQFAPAATGPAAGQITIASNSTSGGTATIALSGTGGSPPLSAFYCSTASVIGTTTDICTVKLGGVSANAPVTVSLSSSDPAVSVPATVTVPANLAAVQFTANILSVLTSQTATLTAIDGGAPMSIALQLSAAPTPSASATSIALGGEKTPAYGASVTFTATVTGANPTGTVSFIGNIFASNKLGSCTLSAGACSLTIDNLIPGEQIIDASYGGDSNNLPSGSPEQIITVGPRSLASSATTLLPLPSTITYGSSVSLVASVTPVPATGSVTFMNGSTVLGTAPLQAVVGSGISNSVFGLTLGNIASPIGSDNINGLVYPNMPYSVTRSWDQTGVDWADVNASNGAYNWADLDAWVEQNAGHDLLYDLSRTPQWASLYPTNKGHYGDGQCAPPSNIDYWNAWVTAVATRYASSIKYWEISNEPQDPGYWCGSSSGSAGSIPEMVTLARNAYSIIKGIIPSAQIVSPAVTALGYGADSPGLEWIQTFLSDGGGATFDVFGFHGYLPISEEVETESNVVSEVNSALSAASITTPMWDTETGWCCRAVLANAQQPGFISKMYILSQSLGVSRIIWYHYAGPPMVGQMFNNSTGENANVTAFNETYRWLVGATLSAACSTTSYGTLITCEYTRPDGYVAQVVWKSNSTGATYSYTYPAGMTQYRDLTGAIYKLNDGTVTIGDAPILLENGDIPAFAATLSTTALPAGRSSVTALYGGNTYYATSTSSPQSVNVLP